MTGEDLKKKLVATGVSLRSIAQKMGMSEQNLYTALKTKNVSSAKLEQVCHALGWTMSQLYEEDNDAQSMRVTMLNNGSAEKKSDAPINLYDIEASAGLSTLFNSDENQNLIGRIFIPNIPKCDGAVYVKGDSMYPLLKAGDIVAYKKVHNDLSSIIFGEMYLVDLDMDGDDYLAVKYINRSEKGDDYIKLVSYNQHHADKDIHIKYVRALALVKLSIRMNTMV